MTLESDSKEATRIIALKWLLSEEGMIYLQSIKDEAYGQGRAEGYDNGYYVGRAEACDGSAPLRDVDERG